MLDWMASELRLAGLAVHETPGWKSRGFGPIYPKAVMLHHTANPRTGDFPSANLLIAGRSDLKGPLCNLGIARSGAVHCIASGVAHHAGPGSKRVLAALLDGREIPPPGPDDMGGNGSFIGIEVENDGVGESYPEAQIMSVVRTCAVLCRHYGWPARVLHHRQWTKRKIDMSFQGDIRSMVKRELLGAPVRIAGVVGSIELGANVKRVEAVITTDNQGNGWAPLDEPFGKLVAIFTQGPYPARDGYWEGGITQAQETDGRTIIVVTEAKPDSSVRVYASFAA